MDTIPNACWAILRDGPCAGDVIELDRHSRTIEVKCEGCPPHRYTRGGWGQGTKDHSIAHFFYTGTLVI